MSDYGRLARLPLTIEGYELAVLAQPMGPFNRLTTVITLHGGGETGVGEDVCYDEIDHIAQAETGPVLALQGSGTLEDLSRRLDGLDLFHGREPSRADYRDYRRWAFESAALDLALRQSGLSLADALGRVPRPVAFVVSTRLDGDPPSAGRVHRFLAAAPGLRLKLDPTDDWGDDLLAELAALGAVATLDMKGRYGEVDQIAIPRDPGTYRRVLAAFPEAMIEDPSPEPELEATLDGAWARVTWDAPIHRLADITALPRTPPMVNVKPSRVGRIEELLAMYAHLDEHGIGIYGGGQTELGPGRGQIQYLASLFHPDGPNDVAPREYNLPDPPAELPAPPLAPAPAATGFRWGD